MKSAIGLLLLTSAFQPAHAALIVTEVAPWSSGNSPIGADWFELTNTGSAAISLVNWTMDDNSNSFAASVALRGPTSIGAGQSVVYFESTAAPSSTDAAITALFNSTWGTSFVYGTNIGSYGGSGVGLSTGGDAVNIYNGGGNLQANVTFGPSPSASPFSSFDNSALLNNTMLSTLSAVGSNGAYARTNSGITEIGSPGTIGADAPAPTPEPSTTAFLGLGLTGLAVLGLRQHRRKA